MENSKKEKAVKDILAILDGFKANEINEILFKANTVCNENFIFVLNNGEVLAGSHQCE